jgi:hypothetical protein
MTTKVPDRPPAFTFEVLPVPGRESVFTWVIRYRGKTFQRSDKVITSEGEARKIASETVERLRHQGVRP